MFENEYLVNKKIIKEYVLNILIKKLVITEILLIICSIILYLLEGSMIMLSISLVGLITLILFPIITVNDLMENSKRLNNGKIEKTIITFKDNIVMNEGKVHLEFEYQQIEKVIETKNIYALMISKQNAIIVLKDSFTKGKESDFVTFINNKINNSKKVVD